MNDKAERYEGGAAFPRPDTFRNEKVWEDGAPGMSLRDYFASQALVGLGNWNPATFGKDVDVLEKIYEKKAELAYSMADAMLAERCK